MLTEIIFFSVVGFFVIAFAAYEIAALKRRKEFRRALAKDDDAAKDASHPRGPAVFIERSRLGRVLYEVDEDCLRISGHRAMEAFAADIEFHSLSPRVERLSRRFYRPIVVCFGFGILTALMCLGFFFQKKLEVGAVIYFAEILGVFAIAFFSAGVRWLPRLEVVRFKDVVGRVAFDVVKEKAYADEFEEFIEILRDHVGGKKAQQGGTANDHMRHASC